MSGTSADGIDAALVEFKSAKKLAVRAVQFTAYSEAIKSRINKLAHANTAQRADPILGELDRDLAELYARVSIRLIAASGTPPEKIVAIASHGQTVAHRPNATPPESLQLGDGQRIANLTGIPVVSNFRQTDMALGGQGAPLMPAFHKALMDRQASNTDSSGNVLALNLGGIANLSIIRHGDDNTVSGFDTGPANTLLDQWINKSRGLDYDKDGAWGKTGEVNKQLLANLMKEPYFEQSWPKSTGPDYFNLDWLERRAEGLIDNLPAVDVQATLAALTVASITLAVAQTGIAQGKIYVCGGGYHNGHLMAKLAASLPHFTFHSTRELGVPPDWVEATGFAWLGYCKLNDIESSIPSVTGASRAAVLGEISNPEAG